MLMQSNFTRRAAFGQGMLEDMTASVKSKGIACDVAISKSASDKLCELVGECSRNLDFLEEVAWAYRLHETGKLSPLAVTHNESETAITFRALLNCCGEPAEINLKGVRSLGDYGEQVLTLMLPEEEFHFTGRLISLRAEYVSLLAPFVTQEAGMAPLNCIRIEPAPGGGVLLAAVNNHGMGVVHDVDAYCDEPLNLRVSKELVRNCKAKYGEYVPRRVVLDGDKATVEGGSGRVFYIEPAPVLEQGDFPDWRRILYKAVSAAEVSGGAAPSPLYKPESLGLFNFQTGQNGQKSGLRLYPTRSEACPAFVGLVMPLVAGAVAPSPCPDWMVQPSEFGPVDHFEEIIRDSMPVQ
jgi:hypothetical protein